MEFFIEIVPGKNKLVWGLEIHKYGQLIESIEFVQKLLNMEIVRKVKNYFEKVERESVDKSRKKARKYQKVFSESYWTNGMISFQFLK